MGIGDMMPSGGYRPKKPLTKAQLRKMEESYKNAEKITSEVKEKEGREKEKTVTEIEEMLRII